jgi:hypothetical protein
MYCAVAIGGLTLSACGYDAGDRAVSGGTNVANYDNLCELQNNVNHRDFERK